MENKKDCSGCRHHSCEMREPLAFDNDAENVEDTMVAFEEPKPFYLCKASEGPYAGREVGFEPVNCSSFEAPRPRNAEADKAMARFEARMQNRREER